MIDIREIRHRQTYQLHASLLTFREECSLQEITQVGGACSGRRMPTYRRPCRPYTHLPTLIRTTQSRGILLSKNHGLCSRKRLRKEINWGQVLYIFCWLISFGVFEPFDRRWMVKSYDAVYVYVFVFPPRKITGRNVNCIRMHTHR